jgi:hypothetical protein
MKALKRMGLERRMAIQEKAHRRSSSFDDYDCDSHGSVILNKPIAIC